MKHVLRGGIAIILICYPLLVGWSLSHGHFAWVSALLVAISVVRLFGAGNQLLWPLTWFAILCGGLSLILKDHAWLKMYPVMMSTGALMIFATTLIKPPSMIERFARLAEPDLPESGVIWTRKVTVVWCVFFALNALIALATVLFAPMKIWVLYNGVISYVLMGMLMLGEFLLRKRHQRLHAMQQYASSVATDQHRHSPNQE